MNWFVEKNGKQHGPFTSGQLKQLAVSGRLRESDLVRREDQAMAVPAQKITGLFTTNSVADANPQRTPIPPPVPQISGQQPDSAPLLSKHPTTTHATIHPNATKWAKRLVIIATALCSLGLVVVFSIGVNRMRSNRDSQELRTAPEKMPTQAKVYEDLDWYEALITNDFVAIPEGAVDLPAEVISEEFLPHLPGDYSDFGHDALGIRTSEGYMRFRWRCTEDKDGLIRKGMKAKWAVLDKRPQLIRTFEPPEQTEPPKHYRIHDGFVEVGSQLSAQLPDDILWEPVLKLHARTGHKWTHTDRFGFTCDYRVSRFFSVNGIPCLVIAVATNIDGERSSETRWYMKGVGLLRSESRFASGPETGRLASRMILIERSAPSLSKPPQITSEGLAEGRSTNPTATAAGASGKKMPPIASQTVVKILHDPYTHLEMPELDASRIHRTYSIDDLRFQDCPPEKLGDLSSVDFLHGPNGEAIQLQILLWQGDDLLRKKVYFYEMPNGERIRHGVSMALSPKGNPEEESIYVHGTKKCESHWVGRFPTEQLDRYEGDDKHLRYAARFFGVGSDVLAQEGRCKVVHSIEGEHEAPKEVPHGEDVQYWDTRGAERLAKQGVREATKYRFPVRKIEVWDSGVLQSRKVFDRSGKLTNQFGKD